MWGRAIIFWGSGTLIFIFAKVVFFSGVRSLSMCCVWHWTLWIQANVITKQAEISRCKNLRFLSSPWALLSFPISSMRIAVGSLCRRAWFARCALKVRKADRGYWIQQDKLYVQGLLLWLSLSDGFQAPYYYVLRMVWPVAVRQSALFDVRFEK